MRLPRSFSPALLAAVAVLCASFAFAEDPPKSPLEHAKVGQWARYKIQNDMERDFFLDPVEAKAYGLIDQVLEKRP